MKKIMIVLCFLSIHKIAAQNSQFKYTDYAKGIINLRNANIDEAVFGIKIKSDSLVYSSAKMPNQTVAFSSINYIKVKEGSMVKNGVVIGGLIGIAFGIRGIVEARNIPPFFDQAYFTKRAREEAILYSLGGLSLGALLGSTISKWKTYSLSNQKVSAVSVRPDIIVAQKNVGVSLTFSLK